MERRQDDRRETSVHLNCRVPATPSRATVHDISHTGCRLEFAEAMQESGATVLIDLPGAPRVPGRIVWTRGRTAGVAFEEPLAPPITYALGLAEPPPEPETRQETETLAPQPNDGGWRHWFRRLSDCLS